MVINLYRSANSGTVIRVVELGEISSGTSTYQESFSSIQNCDTVVYLNDYIDPNSIVGKQLNFINNTGNNTGYYATTTLQDGFYVSGYESSQTELTGFRNFALYLNGSQVAYVSASANDSTGKPSLVYLATAIINGNRYIGFLGVNDRNESSNNFRKYNCFATNSTWSDKMLETAKILESLVESDAIDNPIGGDDDGSLDFEGDEIDLPGAPDETISGALANGFLNIYKPTAAQLQSFGNALWTNIFNAKWFDIDSVANVVLNAVSDPIDYIIGLFMLPISPTTTASNGIYLGRINVNTISPARVTKQYVVLDMGTLNISELYGNYLDYANSRISIYLPYIGTADIDVQEVNGGTVQLQYIVDVFTGACVANVKCTKITSAPWGISYTNSTVHSYSGNMAIQLPISAASFDTMTQGLINVGLGLGTNTPAVAMQGIGQVSQGFSGDVTTRGSLSSNTGKLGYQTPYLMFTRPIESRPAKLGALHGYSAGVGGKLSQFSGYVECSDVKLDGVTATENEINEIESLLKSGVYV